MKPRVSGRRAALLLLILFPPVLFAMALEKGKFKENNLYVL
jgi:hypothetical protein